MTRPGSAEQKRPLASSGNPAKSDVECFARFLEGDDRGLVELFQRHNHRLYVYCFQFVQNSQQAEDITQEIWKRLVELRTQGKGRSENPLGLILRIARNLCVDALRRERHHLLIDDLPEEAHPVENIPELSEMEELVIQALRHLPEAQREVLVLNAYSGYRFDEIALMLGEPVGAVRTRAWRARTHLGRMIATLIGMEEDREKEELLMQEKSSYDKN